MPLLQTTTAEGALKGAILGRAPHELNDQEAAYLQDCLVNNPGFVDRRGAIQGAISLGNNLATFRPAAIGACYDPSGSYRILVAFWNSSATKYWLAGAVYDASFTFLGNINLAGSSANDSLGNGTGSGAGVAPGPVLLTPSIDGGLLVSYSLNYGPNSNGVNNANNFVVQWRGGYSSALNATVTGATANVTLTSNTASRIVTGSATEIAKMKPGLVIYALGVVKSIDSTTQLSLAAPHAGEDVGGTGAGATLAYPIYAVLGMDPVRTRGRISCASGGTTVTGYGTRFLEMLYPDYNVPVHGDFWVIREPSSGQLIGRQTTPAITSIPSDTSLVGGTISRSIALGSALVYSQYSGPLLEPKCALNYLWGSRNRGWITFTYSGYQCYFNSIEIPGSPTDPTGAPKAHARCWIGGPTRADEMDHSRDDGNWFDVPSTGPADMKGYAAFGGTRAAVLCKANSSYALRGTDPSDFALDKISDDGCLGARAITSWQGNVIWLGRDGIWMYDGVNDPVNLVKDSMGVEWQRRIKAFQTESTALDSANYPLNQAHCFVYRDHLFVNITNTGSTHTVYTDGTARTSNTMQLMIYLPNNALSFLTNFNFVGFLTNVPGNQQEGYAVLVQDSSSTHYLFPMSNMFTQGVQTTDAILTANSYSSGSLPTSVGPWFHMESRKFDAGDGLWRKTWKQLATESLMTSTKRVFLDTVAGLNTTGVRATNPFVGTGLWKAIKVKFNARDQYMSFRLYEDIANRPDTLKLGAWQWGFKLARRGQV